MIKNPHFYNYLIYLTIKKYTISLKMLFKKQPKIVIRPKPTLAELNKQIDRKEEKKVKNKNTSDDHEKIM